MPKIDISNFVGVYPILDAKTMPNNYATEAVNVELRGGKISQDQGLLDTGIPLRESTQSIYLYNEEAGGYWFEFDELDVNVVRGPLARDTEVVTYITGSGLPSYTKTNLAQAGDGPYPAAVRDLGIPKPPIINAVGSIAEIPEGAQELTTFYVQTYVSDIFEEGPPSDPSVEVRRFDAEGGEVALNGLSVPSGNFSIVTRRIYRVETAGVFQLVAELPIADTSFLDNVASENLSDSLPSEGWRAPDPNMIGLTMTPNGVLAGFFGRTVAFSEPYFLHAWPTNYEISFQDEVVGLAVSSSGIVVCTDGRPAIIYGSHPREFIDQKLDIVQPCVSKRSIVDMGAEVIYASPDGLVTIGSGAGLITGDFILPEDWRKRFNPTSIHAYKYDEEYLAFYKTDESQGAFIFNPRTGFRFYDVYTDTVYSDPEDGKLYLKQGTKLMLWDEGGPAQSIWTSKIFLTPPNLHFTHLKVDADSYPVEIDVIRDGEVSSITVRSEKVHRIGSRKRFRQFQFSNKTGAGVSRIQFSSSAAEVN